MIFLQLLSVLALFLLGWVLVRRKNQRKLTCFPHVKGLPLIGVALDFLNPNDALETSIKYTREYGHNPVVSLLQFENVMVTDPNMMEFVLGSNKILTKHEFYKFVRNWLGDGLLTSGGSKWRNRRKILTPSFHYKILEDFVEVFDEHSTTLVHKLKAEVGKPSFDVFHYITLCTLDIICETAMGTSVRAQEDTDSNYVRSIKDMCDMFYKRAFTVLRFDFIYYFSNTASKSRKALKVLRDYSNEVIRKRREFLEANKDATQEEVNEFGVRRRQTFLDTLLRATGDDGKPLTNEEIREEVDTFMFEGHDTTAVAISFTLYSLSVNLDIQKKVYDEILTIFGTDKDRPATFEDLHEMKYLELVIKESLRLYPSVAAFGRMLTEDTDYNGTILPKGLSLTLIPYVMHRDPELYPEPEKFIPERFTTENQAKRHPYAYVPFSAGPRNCIGQKFAMLELKSTISKVLRWYELLPTVPAHQVHVVTMVTIQSSNGIKVQLKER